MKKIILSAIIAAMPLVAVADEVREEAVGARQGFFKMLGINMGVLSDMARGQMDYDEEIAAIAGANIETLTGYHLPGLFLDGTAAGEMDASRALPVVWTDGDDFAAKFNGLREAAAGVSDGVRGGQGNVGPVVQRLGAACKDCHDKFRQPQ